MSRCTSQVIASRLHGKPNNEKVTKVLILFINLGGIQNFNKTNVQIFHCNITQFSGHAVRLQGAGIEFTQINIKVLSLHVLHYQLCYFLMLAVKSNAKEHMVYHLDFRFNHILAGPFEYKAKYTGFFLDNKHKGPTLADPSKHVLNN